MTSSPPSLPERRTWTISALYFRPDHAGIAVYSTDFVDFLAQNNQDVTVVTTFPFYPSWRKRKEDERRLFARESEAGYECFRGYSYVPKRVTTLRRMWHEFTAAAFALVNFVRAGRRDYVVVFSPPLAFCLVAWLWSRLSGAKFIVNVQDLPVDAARSLGMVREGALLRVFSALEGWVYRRADQVTTISDAMLALLREKKVPDERLELVPNWIDVARNSAAVPRGSFRDRQGIASDMFLVSYAGNIGIKQGLDQLVQLAERFRNQQNIHFVIAGEGADKDRIVELARAANLNNLTILPFLDHASYRGLLADSDIVFVGQKAGAGDNFFPSKLLGILAQSRPLIVAADSTSELAREVAKAQCGILAQYGDTESLASRLAEMMSNPHSLSLLARNGVDWVRQFDRQAVLGNWVATITDRLAPPARRSSLTQDDK